MNRIALAAVSVLAFARPAVVSAQTPLAIPDRYSFYLMLGTDTILTERVWRTGNELHGEFLDNRRGARLQYLATLNADASIRTVAAHTYRTPTDTGEIATFQIDSNQVIAELGNGQRARIPGAPGLMPVINPSMGFIEQIMLHVKAMRAGDRTTLPILLIGQPQPTAATITLSADSAVIEYANVAMHLALSADGHVTGGSVPSQRISIVRGPAGDPLVAARKDYLALVRARRTRRKT